MGKLNRKNKIIILLKGRHAGKKAVIIKSFDEGTTERPFPHCLVAGIERYPRKVTKGMKREDILKKSKVKAFFRYVNVSHVIITRYNVDINLSELTSYDFSDPSARADNRKRIGDLLTKRYLTASAKDKKVSDGNDFLFKKLIF
ncbi:hypothetical protein MHBO_001927 [Bonamia ostreae]|uniref:60S ribosomal protein L27 n=1 Tax=Bonamia ostreae TaxID=126728 RepID=A0ABV2AKP0_9EUKA